MEAVTRKKIFAVLISIVFAGLGGSACLRPDMGVEAAWDSNLAPSPAELRFLIEASQANRIEIAMARPVEQKSQNAQVRNYALMMERDHMKALGDLLDLAGPGSVPEPGILPEDAVKQIGRLGVLSGDEFDREYINTMVENHKKSVDMFRTQSGTAHNVEIRKYIDATAPMLEKHLNKAHELQSTLFRGKPK